MFIMGRLDSKTLFGHLWMTGGKGSSIIIKPAVKSCLDDQVYYWSFNRQVPVPNPAILQTLARIQIRDAMTILFLKLTSFDNI